MTEGPRVIAWANDAAMQGNVGRVESAATKRYWARGDHVDRASAEELEHPLYAAEAPNEWKEAVLDALAVYAVDAPITTTPREILDKVIGMVQVMAADHSTSLGLCAWTEDSEGYYSTACGEAYAFNEGTPAQNNARFCHSCGGKIALLQCNERAQDDNPN